MTMQRLKASQQSEMVLERVSAEWQTKAEERAKQMKTLANEKRELALEIERLTGLVIPELILRSCVYVCVCVCVCVCVYV
jgi:hypothetical protein